MDKDEDEGKPDPLTQLVTTFCRGAMTERSGALQEDPLYMSYAQIISKSCGEEEEEGEDEGGGGGEEEGGASIHVSISSNIRWNIKKTKISTNETLWTTEHSFMKNTNMGDCPMCLKIINNFVSFSRVLTL